MTPFMGALGVLKGGVIHKCLHTVQTCKLYRLLMLRWPNFPVLRSVHTVQWPVHGLLGVGGSSEVCVMEDTMQMESEIDTRDEGTINHSILILLPVGAAYYTRCHI